VNFVWGALQVVWVALAALGVGFLLQNDIASKLALFGARPDLILGLLVLSARRTGPTAGAVAGFCVGLMEDALTPDHPGLNAALKCTLGYLCGHLRVSLFWDSPASSALILFAAALLHSLAYYLIVSWGHGGAGLLEFLRIGLPSAAYTAALIPLFTWAVPRILRGRE
jgi:rod shape-determining protein MreD